LTTAAGCGVDTTLAALHSSSLSAWTATGTLFAIPEAMPSWTDTDERQYEHIKDSSLERGVREEKAEEIAARTVNKHRREQGRTPNRRSMGTGNPNRGLEDRTRDEIYNRARDLRIRGRSKMTKAELVEAVRQA
jgi:hypothetical protein